MPWISSVVVPTTAFAAFLCWATYKQRPIGWWGTVALTVVATSSAVVTFRNMTLADLHEEIGSSKQMVDSIQQFGLGDQPIVWVWGASGVLFFLYLLYVRVFVAASEEAFVDLVKYMWNVVIEVAATR